MLDISNWELRLPSHPTSIAARFRGLLAIAKDGVQGLLWRGMSKVGFCRVVYARIPMDCAGIQICRHRMMWVDWTWSSKDASTGLA